MPLVPDRQHAAGRHHERPAPDLHALPGDRDAAGAGTAQAVLDVRAEAVPVGEVRAGGLPAVAADSPAGVVAGRGLIRGSAGMNENLMTACVWLGFLLVWTTGSVLCLRHLNRKLRQQVRAREKQAAAAHEAEREAVRLATGYRKQMRKHGLLVVRKADNQEVWLRGQVWVDGPEEAQ
jgi:hypothetical protein